MIHCIPSSKQDQYMKYYWGQSIVVNYHQNKMVTVFCLIFAVKNFRCSTSLPSFLKNVCGYQFLQAFIVFMCKTLPKNFCHCEVICEKHESLSLRIINNIWYTMFCLYKAIRGVCWSVLKAKLCGGNQHILHGSHSSYIARWLYI